MPTSTLDPQDERSRLDDLEQNFSAPSTPVKTPVSAGELQQHFNKPAAKKPVYDKPGSEDSEPNGKAPPDRQKLNDAEETAGKSLSQPEGTSAAGDDEDDSWYKALEKDAGKGWRRWMFTKRRAAAGGGIIGTLIALVAFFSFTAGPLQFVHIAKLMDQFHFASLEDQSDNRTFRLVRDYRYARMGQIENTRLGIFGNHYANKIEGLFNEAGIETSYSKLFGFRDGLIIDPTKLPADSPFHDPKANFDIDPQTNVKGLSGKQFFIPADKLNYRENNALSRAATESAGISKKFAWVSARIMGERAGVTWHPIKKLDNKILKTAEDRFLAWKKDQASTIDNGASQESLKATTSEGKNATEGATEAAEQGAEAAKETLSEGDQATEGVAAGDEGAVPNFTKSLTVKVGAGGAALAGIACTARGLGENIDTLKQTQLILPLIRYGMEFMALGGQVMTGQGVDLEQLGFFSKYLSGQNSNKQNTSAFDAASIVSESGQGQNGAAPPSYLQNIGKGNPFSSFIPGGKYDPVLKPVCSSTGQAVQLVIGFLGGPISALVGTGISAALGPYVLNEMAHWLSHDAANVFAQGSDAGANIDYGTALGANGTALSAGGRALKPAEVASLNATENGYYQQQYAQQSVAYKLFDPYDQRTAISKLIDAGSSSLSDNIAKMGSAFLNIGHMFDSIGSIFAPRVQAASTPYDYGFPIVGFSEDEMNNPLVTNPYKNADDVVSSILPGHPDYITKAKKCFGVVIDPTTYDITSWQGGTPQYNSGGLESSDCASSSSDWLQLRFYIFDSQTAESASCYEGDDSACSMVGFGDNSPVPAGSSSTSSDGATAATGSAKELAQQILGNKNIDLSSYSSSVLEDVQDSAAGKPGTAGVMTSSVILKLIATVGQSHKVLVTAIQSNGQGHCNDTPKSGCPEDPHYNGDAVDFGNLDGTAVTGRNAPALTVINLTEGLLPSGSRYGQVQCGPAVNFPSGITTFDGDPCTHLHVDVPKSTP